MNVPTAGWSNKKGTSDRGCRCGTWKDHWMNYAKQAWPSSCSVDGCAQKPTLGGHVINKSVTGERIVPLCDSCNKRSDEFALKEGVTVTNANKQETCERSA